MVSVLTIRNFFKLVNHRASKEKCHHQAKKKDIYKNVIVEIVGTRRRLEV